MSQNPIEALGEQLSRMREALEDCVLALPVLRTMLDTVGLKSASIAANHLENCRALLAMPAPSPESLATLARHAEIGRLLEKGLDLWLEVAVDVVGPHGCKLYLGGDIKDTFAPTVLDALRTALGEDSPTPEPTP